MESLGKRIAALRRQRSLTQEQLSEKLNVSAQAVSKWETDVSCPDLPVLIQISEEFGLSLDELVKGPREDVARMPEEREKKDFSKMILRVRILSAEGDKVNVNLPLALVKAYLNSGVEMPKVNGKEILTQIDWNGVFAMAEIGVLGKLVEIESADGDHVDIYLE